MRAVLILLLLAASGCDHPAQPPDRGGPPVEQSTPIARERNAEPGHDLSADEAMGGHTLARHVGRTDDELRERLRREPDISSASTYTDRATAEAVVAAAFASAGRKFDAWQHREGRRPNFAMHYAARRVIGRSIGRGQDQAVPCEDAVVVLRWDDRRQRFYVLTSYPEARR